MNPVEAAICKELNKKKSCGSGGGGGGRGVTGPTGPGGGATGATGPTGNDGAPGANGTNGAPGATGANGANGAPGATGANGTNGGTPTILDKNRASAATTADNQTTGLSITATPANDGYVAILVNGTLQVLGNGIKTKDSYFSVDGGATARTIAAITAGDTLYWNGSIAGFELATTDFIDFLYNV